MTDPVSPPTAPDPYDPTPSFFQRQAPLVAAAAVFVLTVVLAVVSFPPFHTPEFAYAMLIPGIFWAYTGPRLKLFAWTMFAAQAVAWTIILGWLHHVTWGGLLLLGPFVGVWIGTWYLAAWWTMPRMVGRPTFTRLVALVALAGAWVLIEWSRTWLLGGFPWLPLAASQWERASILQIASFTGAYGVSFVLVAMNLGFAAMAHSLFVERQTGWNLRRPEFMFGLFLLMACVSVQVQEMFNRQRFSVPLGRFAFVQPYIPQNEKWDPAKAREITGILESITLKAGESRPDLILWPEASTPLAVRGDAQAAVFAGSLAARARTPLLLGSIVIEDADKPAERWYNGALLVTPDGGVQPDFYGKRHLVPFGEYVPLRPLFGWLSKFVPIGGDFARGAGASPLVVPLKQNPAVFGPLICYEDIFPDLARDSVRSGAEVLAVLTNSAWYGEGGAAYQHAAHAVLRAVETRRPVLRCGNGGWSGWIDEFGGIRSVVTNEAGTIYFRGTRTVTVTRDRRWIGQESMYVQYGDWFVLVCVGAVLFGAGTLLTARPVVKKAD
ncbi:MAG: apolipoprotein N-acyltransferase [Verrucomicrobia bacterium]|nr:apolipoprotein N-acyltransferase [Verrucomicrobiota bacterium]